MAGARAVAPPALKHGLTSRWLFEAMQEEVEELAEVLIGASPPEPEIMSAARQAADTILRLRQVRAMKIHTLNEAEPGRQAKTYAAEMYREIRKNAVAVWGGAGGGSRRLARKAGEAAELAMLSFLGREEKLLQRLDEYERRALSQRAEAIRQLDLARIEAERRRLS